MSQRLRLAALALCALPLAAAAACSDPVVEESTLIVRFEGAEAVEEQPDALAIWARYARGGERAVLPEPALIDISHKDMYRDPARVELVLGEGVQGPVDLYAVALVQGGADAGRWPLGRPLLVGSARFELAQTGPRVLMYPFAALCDQDRDYFQNHCDTPGCCPDFAAADGFIDCWDEAPEGRPDLRPERAFPFQQSETATTAGLCGNGIADDCDGADVACDSSVQDLDGDGDPAESDCDDADPNRYQGADDPCGDGIDQDCDGQDAGCDRDGDGYIAGEGPNDDCNDAVATINPGASELTCDRRDEDCDGQVDEGIPCNDIDRDGVPNDADCTDATPGPNGLPGKYDAGRSPQREELCGNGIDEDCTIENGQADRPCDPNDLDRDGYLGATAGGRDCDDTNPTVWPGAPERCGDGVDQDCLGGDQACGVDNDGDRFDAASDCDDTDASIHPPEYTGGALSAPEELCDGEDNDCDSIIDEGNPLKFVGACDPSDGANTCAGPSGVHTRAPRCGSTVGTCEQGWSVCVLSPNGGVPYLCAEEIGPSTEVCDYADNDCDGADDSANGVTVRNACNGCMNLSNQPGTSCGTCGQGVRVCEGRDDVRCDHPERGVNACGGCDTLPNAPGDSCGQCGQYECAGLDSLRCNDPGRNACGGCAPLNRTPGTSCGDCGTRVCDGPNSVRCDDPGTNACGGCSMLANQPNTACGQCGTRACDGQNATRCNDRPYNACGGCATLAGLPGATCGQCGQYACNGTNAVMCNDPGRNACDGCGSLTNQPGASCGQCGQYVCSSTTATTCMDPGRNTCGGCTPLSPAPGTSCGECGTRVCDGMNATRCDDPGDNACGGCTALPNQPGADCGMCGEYVCNGMNAVMCDDGDNACGGCGGMAGTVGANCNTCGTLQCTGNGLSAQLECRDTDSRCPNGMRCMNDQCR